MPGAGFAVAFPPDAPDATDAEDGEDFDDCEGAEDEEDDEDDEDAPEVRGVDCPERAAPLEVPGFAGRALLEVPEPDE